MRVRIVSTPRSLLLVALARWLWFSPSRRACCGSDNETLFRDRFRRVRPLTVPDDSVAADKTDDEGSTDATGETGSDSTSTGTDTGGAGTGTDTGGAGTGTGTGTDNGTTTTPQDTGGAAPGN